MTVKQMDSYLIGVNVCQKRQDSATSSGILVSKKTGIDGILPKRKSRDGG
jgi:hypothetical protein